MTEEVEAIVAGLTDEPTQIYCSPESEMVLSVDDRVELTRFPLPGTPTSYRLFAALAEPKPAPVAIPAAAKPAAPAPAFKPADPAPDADASLTKV